MISIDDTLLQSNNFELLQFEHLPIDYVFDASETVETFVVRGDLIFNLDEEKFGWCQELLPETETQVNASTDHSVDQADDVSSVDTFQLSEPAEQRNNDQRTEKMFTKKRTRNPQNWKANIAKVNRQSGKSYITKKGVKRQGKLVVTKGCANESTCPFQCMEKIDRDGRQYIHDSYWALDDKEKRHFYVSNVKRSPCARKRTKSETSQKEKSFQYYFNYMHVDIQVCQQFFVKTLNINKGRVYYFFGKSNERKTVTPGPLMHGKHTKKVLDERRKQEIRDHINKFPRMESHYCRQNTKKQYLDPGLNLSQMYRLYATESENPLKFSAYRNIFNYEFNLAFYHPKKDRCEKCVEQEQLRNTSEQQIIAFSQHRKRKTNAHNERNKDRDVEPEIRHQNKSVDAEFDLENVFQLPIANASILFYLRKFGVYNLTVVVNKIVYNVIWNEFICGRAGTHLASALLKVLKRIVLDNPEKEHLTLWSDSCVPQNRNSFMSAALQEFLNSNHSGNLQIIDHKYSEAGHGEVQNVDCAHSVIEKFLRGKFIYSPVSLLKEFRKIPPGKSQFVILEMEDADYFDYETLAQASKYKVIPYKKVVQLTYKKNDTKISFKLDFEDSFITTDILLKQNYTTVPELQGLELHSTVTAGKMADIEKMYGIMPEIDRVYYQNGFEEIMGKLSLQTLTSVTKNISKVNDADKGPNGLYVVAEHIEDPKNTTADHGNNKLDAIEGVKRAKKTKTTRPTAGAIRSGDEVHLEDSENRRFTNLVEQSKILDERAKKTKTTRRTAGAIRSGAEVHLEDLCNQRFTNLTKKSKNVDDAVERAKTKTTTVSGNAENIGAHFKSPKRKSTTRDNLKCSNKRIPATTSVDSSKNLALSNKSRTTISLRNRNKKIYENVDATGEPATSTGGVHTDPNNETVVKRRKRLQ